MKSYGWSSSGGYGSLCDIGHQGLLHDKEFGPASTGLVHNRARTLNPPLARFHQRDPLGYVDGMGLYEYCRSGPAGRTDPSGEIVVVMSGLGQPYWKGKRMGEDVSTAIKTMVNRYDTAAPEAKKVQIHYIGMGGQWSENKLRDLYDAFVARKKDDAKAGQCSLEQFVVIGHSDGATAIYRSMTRNGKNAFSTQYAPAYIGMVDLVRLNYGTDHLFQNIKENNAADRNKSSVRVPNMEDTMVEAYRQTMGQQWLLPWRGRYVIGADRNYEFVYNSSKDSVSIYRNKKEVTPKYRSGGKRLPANRVTHPVNHMGMWGDGRVRAHVREAAVKSYERRIKRAMKHGYPAEWSRGTDEWW